MAQSLATLGDQADDRDAIRVTDRLATLLGSAGQAATGQSQTGAAAPTQRPPGPLRRQWGVIQSLTGKTCTVLVGGASLLGINYRSDYVPTVGDTVEIQTADGDLIIVGPTAATAVTGSSFPLGWAGTGSGGATSIASAVNTTWTLKTIHLPVSADILFTVTGDISYPSGSVQQVTISVITLGTQLGASTSRWPGQSTSTNDNFRIQVPITGSVTLSAGTYTFTCQFSNGTGASTVAVNGCSYVLVATRPGS